MLTNFRLLGVNLLGVNLKGVQFWGWGHLGLGVRKICSNFNIFEELSFLGLRLSSASFFSPLFFFLSFLSPFFPVLPRLFFALLPTRQLAALEQCSRAPALCRTLRNQRGSS